MHKYHKIVFSSGSGYRVLSDSTLVTGALGALGYTCTYTYTYTYTCTYVFIHMYIGRGTYLALQTSKKNLSFEV